MGINHHAILVNQAKVQACPYHRDGGMRVDGNGGKTPNYEPNSFGSPTADPSLAEPALKLTGDAKRYNHREGNDDYKQAGDLFRLLKQDEQQRLIVNIIATMQDVPVEIQKCQLRHFYQADENYGKGTAQGLGIEQTIIPVNF
jgi:catalase